MSDVQKLKQALNEAVETVHDKSAVGFVVLDEDGTNIMSNASSNGLLHMIDALTVRLGYMLAEDGEQKMEGDVHAYCLGATSVADNIKHKLDALKQHSSEQRNSAGGKHVTEDVTDGSAANDNKH